MLTMQDQRAQLGLFFSQVFAGLIFSVYIVASKRGQNNLRIKIELWSMSLSFELISPPGVKNSAFALKLAYVCMTPHFC